MRHSRLLLDTHAFLWFIFADPRLTSRAGKAISDRNVQKALSMASLWEIAIKVSLHKLSLGMRFDVFLENHVRSRELDLLALQLPHLSTYEKLPFHHRDPFDRLLVAQCLTEGMAIVTADARFGSYGVDVIW